MSDAVFQFFIRDAPKYCVPKHIANDITKVELSISGSRALNGNSNCNSISDIQNSNANIQPLRATLSILLKLFFFDISLLIKVRFIRLAANRGNVIHTGRATLIE